MISTMEAGKPVYSESGWDRLKLNQHAIIVELGGVIDCGSMTAQPVQHETAAKRLSMREK